MSRPRLITFLTDFGLTDSYVGVMKGVVALVNPRLRVIDLTHEVPPQDINAASFVLASSFSYFPAGTVHLAVVDPGVGGSRKPVAVRIREGFLVGPDNGIFSGVFLRSRPLAAAELTEKKYWRTPDPSSTFHGRDIFASVAAFLANGVQLNKIGAPIKVDQLVRSGYPSPELKNNEILGIVQYIDRFGNLITNIPSNVARLAGSECFPVEFFAEGSTVLFGDTRVPIVKAYSDRKDGELVALTGSHGFLEISKVNGNAQSELKTKTGDSIRMTRN